MHNLFFMSLEVFVNAVISYFDGITHSHIQFLLEKREGRVRQTILSRFVEVVNMNIDIIMVLNICYWSF